MSEERRHAAMVESDLIKELVIAFSVIAVIVLICAIAFSSPDPKTLTAQDVATSNPLQIEATALHILTGENAVASYGPPYNNGTGSVQHLGPFSPQTWAGITLPVNAEKVFFLDPLSRMTALDPALGPALSQFQSASAAQQKAWETAFGAALKNGKVVAGQVVLTASDSGPLNVLMPAYLNLARSGTLEASINLSGRVYQTDFTRALLLLQGTPLQNVAAQQNLLGNQWGMMKEPGNFPGAVWLWFYTLLYQIPAYAASASVDLLVGLTVGAGTLILLLVPWIPGLRDIPRAVPLYRVIWRRHYARQGK